MPCLGCYCAACYKASDEIKFHIHKPKDDEGLVWKRRKDDLAFLTARNGDNIYTPFQCDLCWFRNIMQRLPYANSQADKRLLVYIRRVSLDAF